MAVTNHTRLPKHAVVADKIRLRIRQGAYAPGVALPGRRQLATEYDAAPLTIQTAVDELVAEGLLRTENGRGTYVAGSQVDVVFGEASAKPLGLVGILARAWGDNWDVSGGDNPASVKAAERLIGNLGGASVCVNLHRRDNSLIPLVEGMHVLREKGVSGILVVNEDQRVPIEACLADPLLASIPTVFAVGQDLALPVSTAYYDNVHWGELAAQHLLDQGCRRLLMFSPYGCSWALDRARGVRTAVQRHGLPHDALVSMIGDLTTSDGIHLALVGDEAYYRAGLSMARALIADGISFDGVVAANDHIALGLRDVLQEAGIVAGRDYALIGFDDKSSARLAGLTSMQLPAERLGRRAAEVLARLIRGERGPINVRVGAHVIARESTAVAFGASRSVVFASRSK